jgi:hypothetical protein
MDFTIEFWLYPGTMENGEQILFWRGRRKHKNDHLVQEISCSFDRRHLVWEFNNIFIPIEDKPYTLSFTSDSTLVPETWTHHTVRFDGTTGLIEYYIDNEPEAVNYATETGEEDGTVFSPSIGSSSYSPLQIGNYFTGFLDEFRISASFVTDPFNSKYKENSGTAIIRPIDFDYSNSTLRYIDIEAQEPLNSDVYYYYFLSDTYTPIPPDDPNWTPFVPGSSFPDYKKGRYLQILLQLYPDGYGLHTPIVSKLNVTYEPDLPPPPPSFLSAIPGNREVRLSWRPVAESDVSGYYVYYGTKPGRYFGTESENGASPIDVGKTTSVTLSGLSNGTLYFFSVVTYDDSKPPHVSIFSEEVNARPSSIANNKKQ